MNGFGVLLETISIIGAIFLGVVYKHLVRQLLLPTVHPKLTWMCLLCVLHVSCRFGPHWKDRQLQVAPLTHFDDHWTP